MATKEEQALQDALINTYTYNLHFLSEYDYALYERVSALSDAISNNIYQERYFLDFIKENGEFDIFDTKTNSYIYNKNPKKWNNQAIKSCNFDHNNTFSLLNTDIYTTDITDITEFKTDMLELNNLKIRTDIKNYTNIKFEPLNNKHKKVRSINKFIFVGTLLGRHIPKIIKKLNTINHFVCEENLEIFRLSLFVCDYSLLARDGKSVVFAIMEDENIFMEKFNIFFKNYIFDNTFYKYYSTNYNISNYFDRIINVIAAKDPMIFDYRLLLDNMIKLSTKNFNKYKTLTFGKIKEDNSFTKYPILYLGAGPSLKSNIKWLQKNQDRFIIVAMAATLKILSANDIIPDIVTSVDPQEGIVTKQFSFSTSQQLDEMIKIVSLNTPDKVFDMFNNKNNLFTFESLKTFQQNSISIDGVSIGEITLKLLLHLKAKEIYFLGIDLALDQKTGQTHADEEKNKDLKIDISKDENYNDIMLKNNFKLKDDIVITKGNFLETVKTTRLFFISLLDYNESIKLFKKSSQTIYNLSENGAAIYGTIPTKIDDIQLSSKLNKKDIQDRLNNELNASSIVHLVEEDKQLIKNQIIQIDDLINFISEFKKFKIKQYEQFHKELDNISNIMLSFNSNHFHIAEIYLNFALIINRYIDFIFNSRELKDNRKELKEIHYIWCQHIIILLKEYKNYLSLLV